MLTLYMNLSLCKGCRHSTLECRDWNKKLDVKDAFLFTSFSQLCRLYNMTYLGDIKDRYGNLNDGRQNFLFLIPFDIQIKGNFQRDSSWFDAGITWSWYDFKMWHEFLSWLLWIEGLDVSLKIFLEYLLVFGFSKIP